MEQDNFISAPLQCYLERLHKKFSNLNDGAVADYIPELSLANPESFGIAMVTIDGHVYQVGETHEKFTIQSISKAVVYGLALMEHGVDYLSSKVGVEPSGDSFNSISLDPDTGRPLNPMINAGAIATTGLIEEKNGKQPIARILDNMASYVGHSLDINEAVYQSESSTGHRNRAISHLLRNFDIADDNHEAAVETYFKQCSINVDCRDLAVLASCMANNGVNPITGVVALENQYVDKVLSVMGSCGMYDYSGNWLYHVGMPAKSGVGGGIIAVLPGQFGLAVYSPRLDTFGNSVRGIKVCEEISNEFGLHIFHTARSTSASVIRVRFTAKQVHSRKARLEVEQTLLSAHGDSIHGYELQGDLMFGSTDSVIRALNKDVRHCDFLIVDVKRVVEIDSASIRLWLECIDRFRAIGKTIVFTGFSEHYRFVRAIKNHYRNDLPGSLIKFADRDHALEWCEDQLLSIHMEPGVPPSVVPLCDHLLCQGLTSQQLLNLQEMCIEVKFDAGKSMFHRGDKAESMFFIKSGLVEVFLKIDAMREKRLTTLRPGMTFGELAMLNKNRRAADIRALKDTVCYQLDFCNIDDAVRTVFLTNLAGILASKIEKDTQEIEAMC